MFSGMFNNTFPSSVHFFALTNLNVRFYFDSATFFLSFLADGSSISKNSPWTSTVASSVRSWWISSLLSGIGSSTMHCVSEPSMSLLVSLSICQAL